jgi:hypothetical protein
MLREAIAFSYKMDCQKIGTSFEMSDVGEHVLMFKKI